MPRSPGLHSCLSPMHTASGARPRGPARRVADRRDAISCAAASASAGYGRKRRLTPLGRSSTIYRQCLEAAHLGDPISPRYRSARRKTTTTLPQRGGTSGTVPVELPYPSALSQRSARLSSGQSGRMAQHPVVQARRPAPRVPRACSHTQVRRVSSWCQRSRRAWGALSPTISRTMHSNRL